MKCNALGPFEFSDPSMESRYREYWASSCLIRNRPLIWHFWFPAILLVRALWLVYWFLYPYEVSTFDLIPTIVRLFVLLISSTIFLRDWSSSAMLKFGIISKWASRTMLILLGVQHFGSNHRDSQLMMATASVMCCSGLVIPSFTEYLGFVLFIPYIRPMRIYMSSNDGLASEQLHEVLFQHTLLLTLALSVTWTVHSDSRRDWLRSSVSFGHETVMKRKSEGSSAGSRSTQQKKELDADSSVSSPEWDMIRDNYFSIADRQELRTTFLEVCLYLHHKREHEL